ncbi:MAG: archease [Thermoplasmata archaeon]
MPYKQFEHTADIGLEAWGDNLEKAFQEAAKGMFDVFTDIDTVEPREKHEIKAASDSLETLLVDFLSEFVFMFEVKSMLFCEFQVRIQESKEFTLEAVCRGEEIDLDKHPLDTAIKAVSYHEILVDREGKIRVIFDV